MTKTVLIIEDNELNMKLFCDVLESCGYRTLRAYSGTAGLQAVRSHYPDLIVMDIQLPDISGLDVTRTIKADRLLNHTPIVAVTAFSMKGDEEKIMSAGCDAYISKPIKIPEFINVIEGMLSPSETKSQPNSLSHGTEDSDP